ncbi:hypothetical protein [Luteibacter sp. 329MFSha]|uniref:hypothetical protein n=1 Tax=Luteibacter sp. 329MFSha TaxID=1798239 RepID=UPI0008CF6B16|nr:hypothetical protein [Luteibacter sp. 329MFSha]SEW25544.1 hypothetical protein SAMN04515660_3410 [Luteibacter sp. 329MFSha]
MARRSSWDPYRPIRNESPARDVLWSILTHALLLGLAYYLTQLRPASNDVSGRVQATRNAAFQAAATQRLNDLSSAEAALAQRSQDTAPPPFRPIRSARDALEQARARYDALKKKHADLPTLPKMPRTEAEALAQLAQLETQLAATSTRDAQSGSPGAASAAGDAKGGPGGARLAGSAGDAELTPFDVATDRGRGADVVPRGRFSSIPPLDAPVRAAGGRSVGPGGTYANRLYVDTWYVVGPFDAIGDQPLEHQELPELAVDLDGTYAGKSGRTLTWRHVQASEYPLFLPDPSESAVYYGYTELRLDRDREIWAWIGADDAAKVWVDDRLVWKGGAPVKPWFLRDARSMKHEIADYNLSEGKIRLRLSAGRHRVLFKLYNGAEVMFFSLVLSDAQERSNAALVHP